MTERTLRIETTRSCGRVPALLWALEEMGVEYDLVERPAGWFLAHDGTAGPALVDGATRILGLEAPLRHVAERSGRLCPRSEEEEGRMEAALLLLSGLGRRVPALLAGPESEEADEARRAIDERLGRLDALLRDAEHFAGGLTIADHGAILVSRLPRLGVSLAAHPRLDAHVRRMTSRPAWVRASLRLRSLGADRRAPRTEPISSPAVAPRSPGARGG